jgi:hypothetical protein
VFVILHNAFVGAPYEEEWIDEWFLPIDNQDELSQEISCEKLGDERRSQLVGYFSEIEGISIN